MFGGTERKIRPRTRGKGKGVGAGRMAPIGLRHTAHRNRGTWPKARDLPGPGPLLP